MCVCDSRFAEIMAELKKTADGSNLIDRVQSKRNGENGDEVIVANLAKTTKEEALGFLRELIADADTAAYCRRFQAATKKSSSRYNQFSTDNPQSDRNQIAAEKGGDEEDEHGEE